MSKLMLSQSKEVCEKNIVRSLIMPLLDMQILIL